MEVKTTNNVANIAPKILVVGNSGVGKTTLASTLADYNPIIVSLEGGLLSLAAHSVPYLEIDGANPTERYSNFCKAMVFANQGEYGCIFIDSLTELSEIISAMTFDKYENDKSKTLMIYGDIKTLTVKVIKSIRALNKIVVLTALPTMEKDDQHVKVVVPDVVGSIKMKLPQFFDEVFYMGCADTEDPLVKKRYLATATHDKVIAKDRSGKLDLFERPNLGAIIKKITEVNHV